MKFYLERQIATRAVIVFNWNACVAVSDGELDNEVN